MNNPIWNADDSLAVPIFAYSRLTGDNHLLYNKGIKRYIICNYAFIDSNGNPCPYHNEPLQQYITQLTLFEAPEPWGPWSLFYQDDNWGDGDYQPSFPTKWMSDDGRTLYMVSSGNNENYNFMVQKFTLEI
jgi:hypothetical protein